MISITVPESIDNSKSLQKIIDLAGNTPAKYIFTQDHNIEINSLLRVFNNTEFEGNNCLFRLMDNAHISIFGVQIPIIAPKYPNSATGLSFHDFSFNGNRYNQDEVEKLHAKPWGKGYHNLIALGSSNNVNYNNASNCEFYNINYKDSLGDCFRIKGANNISIHDITASTGGHDVIFASVKNSDFHHINVKTSVNAAVRLASCVNTKVHDCKIIGTNQAYAPGFEIQSTYPGMDCYSIEIYNNSIKNTLGPGMQVAGSVQGINKVSIHNNLIENCGLMPASNNRPTIGAVTVDGFDADIFHNTIRGSHGYGVVAGDYDVGSTHPYEMNIYRNIITDTQQSNKIGLVSGTGIANLLGSRYTISCSGNCLYNNLADLYKITQTNGIYENPLFISSTDAHLQKGSPCRLDGYQLGCYTDEIPVDLLLSCKASKLDSIKPFLPDDHKIYRKL